MAGNGETLQEGDHLLRTNQGRREERRRAIYGSHSSSRHFHAISGLETVLSSNQAQLRENPAWRRRGNVAWVYAKDARHAVDPYDDGVVNFRRLQGARCVCAF